MPKDIERRVFDMDRIETRDSDGDKPAKLIGHAAIFNKLSDDLGGFKERIAPGAFADSLGNDVRALFNHNPDLILGRTKAGTLALEEDKRGLRVEIDPPDTQVARDLMESVKRGDISQMSFGFFTLDDDFERKRDGTIIRTLKKVDLFDVSPVTFPAYPQTKIAMRSLETFLAGEPKPENVDLDMRARKLALMAHDLTD